MDNRDPVGTQTPTTLSGLSESHYLRGRNDRRLTRWSDARHGCRLARSAISGLARDSRIPTALD